MIGTLDIAHNLYYVNQLTFCRGERARFYPAVHGGIPVGMASPEMTCSIQA